jgi:hypothetical protein
MLALIERAAKREGGYGRSRNRKKGSTTVAALEAVFATPRRTAVDRYGGSCGAVCEEIARRRHRW